MSPTARPTDPSRKVLVAHASRHGSTAQIAERIAERLSEAGLDAVALDVDEEGNDLLVVARPKDFDELHELFEPRGEQVFFGKWDPAAPPVGLAERMMKFVPAGRDALPSGDFRDWPVIDAWADEIAAALLGLEQPTTT